MIKQQVLERMWRKGNPHALLVGMQTGVATMENGMEGLQIIKNSPDWCGSVGWALSRKAKGHRFNSRSGLTPGLQVPFPVGAHAGGKDLQLPHLSGSRAELERTPTPEAVTQLSSSHPLILVKCFPPYAMFILLVIPSSMKYLNSYDQKDLIKTP